MAVLPFLAVPVFLASFGFILITIKAKKSKTKQKNTGKKKLKKGKNKKEKFFGFFARRHCRRRRWPLSRLVGDVPVFAV